MSEMKEVKIGKDKISVALCTYNGEKFIREQLRSIVGQDDSTVADRSV